MNHDADGLTLGDPVLDREHAELQRLIDALRQAPPADALAALDALKAHAGSHLRAVLERPQPPAGLIGRLAAELTRWLPEHVQAMDACIASVRTRDRFGGVPIQLTRRAPS